MKIVITGALGHIGSRLAQLIPERYNGAEVVLIDNLTTQRFPSLFNLPDDSNYKFIEIDVTVDELKPIFEGADVVVQLAAITDATSSFDRREEVERVNHTATMRIAEACADVGTPMIFPSSTSVYGTQKTAVDESCGPEDLQPQSPYAETKLREEVALSNLASEGSLRHISMRLGTIFGASPGMRFHTAVNKFCWQAVMGQELTIWRTAYDQMRPYLDLIDACHSFFHVLDNDLFDGRVYNVLTLNATVSDIVEAIRHHIPDLSIGFVDAEIMNQLSYEVARGRFVQTGFNFTGGLETSIGATIDLLRNSNGARS
jgi:UDP-glucose 4-epimerase